MPRSVELRTDGPTLRGASGDRTKVASTAAPAGTASGSASPPARASLSPTCVVGVVGAGFDLDGGIRPGTIAR
jgi:hypothetical protein